MKRPSERVYFLIFFSTVFFLMAGLCAWEIQSWRRRIPVEAPPAATTRVVVIALEGLLFEEGVTQKDLAPSPSDPALLFYRVDPAFPLESFKEKLQGFLPGIGYKLADYASRGQGEFQEATFKLRAGTPAARAKDLTLVIAKRHLAYEPPPTAALAGKPRLAIVIDDLGLNREAAEKAADLPGPVTFSVMPQQPASEEIANLAARKGKEVLLHLPMEPLDFPDKDPGLGALMSGMTGKEMSRVIKEDLLSIPGAVGVNNHMGSRLTADAGAMEVLMDRLAALKLFFLDSRTTPNSVAFQKARSRGLRAIRRDIFLDNLDEPEAIRAQIDELIKLSLSQGAAVGIGHPRDNTLAVLAQDMPRIRAAGVEIVPLSALVR